MIDKNLILKFKIEAFLKLYAIFIEKSKLMQYCSFKTRTLKINLQNPKRL